MIILQVPESIIAKNSNIYYLWTVYVPIIHSFPVYSGIL